MLMPKQGLLVVGCAAFLSSCGVAAFIEDGPLPPPRAQAETGPNFPARFSGAILARYNGGYGDFFNSANLDHLINEAATNNPDYLLLRARVDREILRIADTRLKNGPTLSASFSNVEKRGPLDASSYSLSVDLNPNLDVWGKTAADIRSGELGSRATIYDLIASERAMQKSIVRAWANLIAARVTLQKRFTRLAAYNDVYDAMEGEVISGRRPPIDLQSAEIDVIGAKSHLENQRQQTEAAEATLNRLLGRPIGQRVRLANGVLPRFAGVPPARLPSELLTRRPDIQSAWARLLAADESFKSARLGMLPRFNITGSLGNSTTDLADLLDPARFVSSLISSLSATLLDNGASQRQVEMALKNVEVELHSYASTVLNALNEVQSILSKERSLKRQITLQKASASLSNEAFSQQISAMQDGSAGLFEVSNAALRLYNAEDEIISLRNQILQNRLDLYVALGDEYFDGDK